MRTNAHCQTVFLVLNGQEFYSVIGTSLWFTTLVKSEHWTLWTVQYNCEQWVHVYDICVRISELLDCSRLTPMCNRWNYFTVCSKQYRNAIVMSTVFWLLCCLNVFMHPSQNNCTGDIKQCYLLTIHINCLQYTIHIHEGLELVLNFCLRRSIW